MVTDSLQRIRIKEAARPTRLEQRRRETRVLHIRDGSQMKQQHRYQVSEPESILSKGVGLRSSWLQSSGMGQHCLTLQREGKN